MSDPVIAAAASGRPMKRRTAQIILRACVQAAADGYDTDRCQKEAAALLDIVAARGLTDE